MNIIQMTGIEDNRTYHGFLDRDPLTGIIIFYYFDCDNKRWLSDRIEKFMPVSVKNENNVIGG